MDQNALTIVAPIKPNQTAELTAFLNQIGTNLRHNPYLDISHLLTTHFLRWVILTSDDTGPDRLLFESNHDGDTSDYLQDFLAQAGLAVDAIYAYCIGYPVAGISDKDAVLAYLLEHSIPYEAFYIGYRGRSAATVKAALAARESLAQFIDAAQSRRAFDGLSDAQIWDAIQAEAARQDITPIAPQKSGTPVFYGLAAGIGLAVLLKKPRIGLPLLALLGGFAAFLRWRETRDAQKWQQEERAKYLPSYASHIAANELARREDILAQNQLTHVVKLRPGLFRRFTIKAVLGTINLLAKIVFNKGNLGGIPTIHFARWVLLDDGHLVFFSNYDGSWDNYLGDFVDRAANGLTGVWSNTQDFPPTRFLLWDGARAIELFKAWTRAHQVPTQVWYSAYPDNTVVNIRDAVQTLENLGQTPTPQTLPGWLRRL